MTSIVLCEGPTDAILLSYYMCRVYGWNYSKSPKTIKISEGMNESVNWYKRGSDYLLIYGVGGNSNFKNIFDNKIKDTLYYYNCFDSLVVITDRDNKDITRIENHISSQIVLSEKFVNRKWVNNTYVDSFGLKNDIKTLLVVIPTENQGALENVMLEAISENPYDAVIVDKVRHFVSSMRETASKYITSDRMEVKADLGVTWAVQYPEKVFRLIDEQIKSVPWEDSKVLKECFGILGEL